MKILVGIDGSQHAEKALDYALDLAERYSANIVLLSVVPPVTLPIFSREPITGVVDIFPVWAGTYYDELRASYEKVLAEALEKAKKIKPNLNVSTKLAEGRPADKIIETAKEGNFDLIVLGSRGLGGIEEFLLGSVSHKVVNEAECPVLVVK